MDAEKAHGCCNYFAPYSDLDAKRQVSYEEVSVML